MNFNLSLVCLAFICMVAAAQQPESIEEKYADCVAEKKAKSPFMAKRYTDRQIAAICQQEDDYKKKKEEEPAPVNTDDQSTFLNKLSCKDPQGCFEKTE